MALPSCNCVAGLYPNWRKLGPIVAAARTWAGEAPNLHCYDNRPIQDQLNALYCAIVTVSGGGGGGGGATLLASFYIPEIVDTFERSIAAGYSGSGDPLTFQREAAIDVLRSAHYQSGISGQLVILEDTPTLCEIEMQPATVVPGELEFDASYDAASVTVSLQKYQYRIDAGGELDNGTNLTLTNISASAGIHTLGIRAVSTSGVFGPWATSNPFEVTSPPLTEILEWPMQEGSGSVIGAATGPDGTLSSGTWAVGPGGSGFSIDFDGSSTFAQSDSAVAYGTPVITIEAWIYSDDWTSPTENVIWESGPNYGSGPVRFYMGFQAGSVSFNLFQSGAGLGAFFVAFTEGLAAATWYKFTVVYNNDANAGAGEIKCFVDDVEITLTISLNTKAGTGDMSTETLNLGARNGAGSWLGGRISDLVIYEGDIT